jgi:flagellar hook-basal body complex protein FliE
MNPIRPTEAAAAAPLPGRSGLANGRATGFAQTLGQAVDRVGQSLAAADQASEQLATGKAESISEVALAIEQADLSFRLLARTGQRLVEAYREIQRMNV